MVRCLLFLKKTTSLFLLFVAYMVTYTFIVLRIESYISHEKYSKNAMINTSWNNFKWKANGKSGLVTKQYKVQKETSKEGKCVFDSHMYFALCKEKYNYIRYTWDRINCLKEKFQIDGSHCSIYNYLTNVEPFCAGKNQESLLQRKPSNKFATPRYDIDGVLRLMPGEQFSWMKQRVTDMWDDWLHAIKAFTTKYKVKYTKKKIKAFMGSMASQPKFMTLAGKGGPLGELIQWTDLIVGLYVLGYDVEVYLNGTNMGLKKDVSSCSAKPSEREYDVMFTDVKGVVAIFKYYGFPSSARYRCTFRILDSFGTMPEYNYPPYPNKIPGGRSGWGDLNLIPQQFYTLYPHTHDNTFLGFVVGSNRENEEANKSTIVKKDKALLYAKLSSYIGTPELQRYLRIVSEYFEIHATAREFGNVKMPEFIVNHGPVSGKKVKEMLLESKLFIGVGFPYEGPGPMEAMATGTPMIQPKFKTPKNKLNEPFFKLKPTLRKLTSQSPYVEEFVGEPYVFTIDIADEQVLRTTLKKVKNMKQLPPKIPREFTNEGLLERLHVFVDRVDYCNINKPRWPPIEKMIVHIANFGQSCKDVCMSKGLVCEREFFDDLNSKDVIERHAVRQCRIVKEVFQLNAPAFDPASQICYLQAQKQLYSCSHRDQFVRQICPCREYEKEQSAICKGCI